MTYVEIAYNATLGIMTVLSLTLSIISGIGYKRTHNSKFLFILLAFISFFIKGIWLSYNSYMYPLEMDFDLWLPVLVLDNMILILFYLTSLKR
ncbi:MAG: hypothetical protein ACQEQM_04430 [Thermoplasmatota archaeon]